MTAKCGTCKLQNTCSYDDMIKYGQDCKTYWPEKGYKHGVPKRPRGDRGGA